MNALRALLLAETDDHHFANATLVRPTNRIVRFDAAGDNDSIGLMSISVLIDRLAELGISEENRLHGRPDRTAHSLGGDSISLQQLSLSFRSCPAVAAHGRHNKWICPALFAEVDDSAGDGVDICNTATAGGDCNAHAGLDRIGNFRPGEFFRTIDGISAGTMRLLSNACSARNISGIGMPSSIRETFPPFFICISGLLFQSICVFLRSSQRSLGRFPESLQDLVQCKQVFFRRGPTRCESNH